MKKLLVLATLCLLPFSVHADLDESMDKMCEKLKTCAIAEVKKEGEMPEEMIQSMMSMFDGLCDSMLAEQAAAVGDAGLESKAEACIDSMVETDCDTMMAAEGNFKSQQCEDYRKAADKAGLKAG